MKKFSYKFSGMLYAVIAVGLAVAAFSLVWNIVKIVQNILANTVVAYYIISYSVAIIMSAVFLVLIIAMLLDSGYILDDSLTVKFGLIKTTYEYKKIKQLVWFKENNKLTFFHDDESFTNVVIRDTEYEAFAEALKEKAPNIVYFVDINEKKQ